MGIFAPEGRLARCLNGIGNLIVWNLLTILCSLPVVTAGAAMTALYTMTLRMTRKEDGNIIREYFQAFGRNFRQATLIWLAGGGLMVFMAFDIYILRGITGTFGMAYRIILFFIILCFAMVLIQIFAMLARFDNTIKNTVKNGILLTAGRFPQAVLMLFLSLAPVILLMASYRFLSVDILLGLSGPAYLGSLYFTSVFQKFEQEGNENAQD